MSSILCLYMNKKNVVTELPNALIRRKVDLCHELLEVADKLEPGWSRFRGTLLLELQAAMTMKTKREYETGKITKAGAQVRCLLNGSEVFEKFSKMKSHLFKLTFFERLYKKTVPQIAPLVTSF